MRDPSHGTRPVDADIQPARVLAHSKKLQTLSQKRQRAGRQGYPQGAACDWQGAAQASHPSKQNEMHPGRYAKGSPQGAFQAIAPRPGYLSADEQADQVEENEESGAFAGERHR